jgi:hypothetical protein
VQVRDDAAAEVATAQARGFNVAIWTMLGTATIAASGMGMLVFRKPK